MKRRSVVVVGFGVTGRAVARALSRRGDQLVIFDDQPSAEAEKAAAELGLEVRTTPAGSALAEAMAATDLIVPSPGVPYGHPVYAAAAAAGVPVWAEIELAARQAQAAGGPVMVAVTGTNGKTTVVTLVAAILQASGIEAVAAGNIGLPLLDAVASGAATVVAEVSSFQLQFTELFRPSVSCWLNFAPDHLDWHPDLDHYAAAKSRVWRNQLAGDTAVVNADDAAVMSAAASIPSGVRRLTFSGQGSPADYRLDDGRLLAPDGSVVVSAAELPRALPHDVSNALAATAVAVAGGATLAGCRQGLIATAPLPHRVALVAEHGGVRWFDDSKATTPASVLAAAAGFDSVVLIAGGRNKGLDLSVLARTAPPVRAVVAIGEAAAEVVATFEGRVPVEVATSMEAAVSAAGRMARPGDAVLLSPGCASFDWYSSYAQRGDDFAAVVTRHLHRGGA